MSSEGQESGPIWHGSGNSGNPGDSVDPVVRTSSSNSGGASHAQEAGFEQQPYEDELPPPPAQQDAEFQPPTHLASPVSLESEPSVAYEEESEAVTTRQERLEQLSKSLSLIIAPLLFAGLTCLFVLPLVAMGHAQIPPEGFWPITMVILAVAVAQAIFVYQAGSDNGLWAIGTLGGFCLFMLVGITAIFGLLAGGLLLIAFIALFVVLGRLYINPVVEGYVDILYAFGKYSRTLYPGFNIRLPWEKQAYHLNVGETVWVCPAHRVQMSRDEDIIVRATVSYQLMPEDAELAVLHVKDWETSLRDLFISMLDAAIKTLKPDDFLAWPNGLRSRPGTNGGMNTGVDAVERWEPINHDLLEQLGVHVAPWGVQVNMVRLREVVLAPHNAAMPETDPALYAQPASTRSSSDSNVITQSSTLKKAATRETPVGQAKAAQPDLEKTQTIPRPAAAAATASVASAASAAAPAATSATATSATATASPAMLNEKVLKKAYKQVQDGNITDPDIIRDIAQRFETVARDPLLSQTVSFDAGRAANNLYNQANKYAEQATIGTPYNDDTKPDWPMRRPTDENLMAGG